MTIPIALQLYSVRDEMARDFDGTLHKIAAMGYAYVEFAGFYERSAQQVKSACDKAGLKACSAHLGIDVLQSPEKLDAMILAAKTLGFRHLVLSWLGPEYRDKAGYAKGAAILTSAAQKAATQGVGLCYHNHSFEFEKDAGGVRGIDVLFGPGAGKSFGSELDIYWVTHGRDNPVAWMNKLSGRLPLLHIKDMDATPERSFTEVGTGIIDFKPIVGAAKACGVQYFIIEQDSGWKGGALASAKTSLQNFRKIAGA